MRQSSERNIQRLRSDAHRYAVFPETDVPGSSKIVVLGTSLAVLIVTIVALGLRLWHLEFQSLWWDEGVSIYLSGAGVRALTVAKDFSVDLHPPGYHLALAVWRVFLGPSVFADRLFSVFCGTLTVPLLFQFVRRVTAWPHPQPLSIGDGEGSPDSPSPSPMEREGSPWRRGSGGRLGREARGAGGEATALVAALLVAVSPIDVYYSQETRMYALLPVLGLASLIVTTLLLKRATTRRWLLWIGVNAIGLYVYYYLGLLTAAEALALLGTAVRRREGRAWLLAQVATLAIFAPWAILMARSLDGSALALPPETAVHLTPTQYLLDNWRDFTIGFTSPPGATELIALFVVATVAGAIVLGKRSPPGTVLVLLCLAVPLAGAGAVLLVRPFFYPRFILFAAIPIWTLTAIGLTVDRRIWPLTIALLTLITAGNGWTWYHERTTPRVGYAPDDYRVVFSTLDARAQPGDVVLCGYPWQAGYVQAYLWKDDLRTAFLPGHVAQDQLDRSLGPSGRAWVFEYSPDRRFAGNWLRDLLGSRAKTLVVDQFGDSRVELFAPTAPAPSLAPPVQATLGSAIALRSSQIHLPTPAGPGDAVQITLRWRGMSHPAASYTVFVHLLGPDGKVAAQHDGPPVGGAFPTDGWNAGEEIVDRYTLTIPQPAPAGAYQVELGMYQSDTGQRLVVGPTPEKDNRIVIGEFSIRR